MPTTRRPAHRLHASRRGARAALAVPALVALASPLGCGSEEAPGKAATGGPSPVPFDYALDDVLRINHLQAKGTHNSYHVYTEGSTVEDWMYTHEPLDVQLATQGVRMVEIDTRFIAATERFEVFHLPIVDEATTCRVFVDCLSAMRGWSDRFPGHHPLFVMIEPKDEPPPAPDDEAYFERFEVEILSVWPRERVVTPDDVRGDASTLREAVTTRGWPTLREARGKILFFVNDTGAFRNGYTRDGESLDARLMFVESSPDDPFAAVLVLNDATSLRQEIEAGVKAGFFVRTFADGAPDPDPAERDVALEGGAHVISSDYPAPVEQGGYSLEIPGGTPSRCNPLVAPPECTSEAIEDPRFTTEP